MDFNCFHLLEQISWYMKHRNIESEDKRSNLWLKYWSVCWNGERWWWSYHKIIPPSLLSHSAAALDGDTDITLDISEVPFWSTLGLLVLTMIHLITWDISLNFRKENISSYQMDHSKYRNISGRQQWWPDWWQLFPVLWWLYRHQNQFSWQLL